VGEALRQLVRFMCRAAVAAIVIVLASIEKNQ